MTFYISALIVLFCVVWQYRRISKLQKDLAFANKHVKYYQRKCELCQLPNRDNKGRFVRVTVSKFVKTPWGFVPLEGKVNVLQTAEAD